MYSDNHFEDLAFEPGSSNAGYTSAFDINDFGLSTELFSDPSYHVSSTSNNPLLQTIQRNTASSSRHDYATSHLVAGGGSGNNVNDDPSSSSSSGMNNIGNALLGSPQPSTIKKLKSHLSGIGGIGGYLTSPMGSFRQNNNNNNNNTSNSSSTYSVLKPTVSSSGTHSNNHHSLGSSPLKPNHSSSQQQQDPQCLELLTPLPPPPMPQPLRQAAHQYTSQNNTSMSSTSMQRLQSAPASVPQASTSSSSGRSSKSKKNNNNNDVLNVPQSATSATFNEMDYGGMRVYGRPIQRSASEDPSNSNINGNTSSNNNTGSSGASAGFLPYPEQLPTVTLGRGVKNARDITASTSTSINSSSSFPMSKSESEPIPTPSSNTTTSKKGFTNLNKPFIQYVAPNSPAAKSAAARNKKSLTVKTSDGTYHQVESSDTNNNNRGKMVPIKMARQAHEMPLTPPISANMMMGGPSSATSMTSPQQQQHTQMQSFSSQNMQQQPLQVRYGSQQLNPYQQPQQQGNNSPYFSPVKNTFDFNNTDSQGQLGVMGGQSNTHSNMPSFEFSLEEFGGGSQSLSNNNHDILDQFSNNGYNGNAIDFSSVLGLPSPHQLRHQGSHSSNSSSNHHNNHGLLSPPPHSAASSHSSVFSDDQDLLFGMPPASPYFSSIQDESQQQSIDQALASLLGTQVPNRDGSATPQPQLNIQNFSPSHHQQQMFSPNMQQQQQHQGQIALGISSPPLSPQQNTMTSPAPSASWAPYQQQTNMQNLLPNIDPSLQGLDNQHQQNLVMLSPQSAHFGNNNNHHYSPSSHQQQQQFRQHHTQTNNGRIMSSPRRLRGMQSAPDLNAMYSDASNGFNEAFGITSPSPRKPSHKRGRGSQYGEGESDEENQQGHNQYGYTQYGDGSSEQDDEDDEYSPNDGYDRPPARKRANSIHSGGKVDPNFVNNHNNTIAAVLLPLVNPNPARLRPGPKPKTSLPNLQAAHQGVFQVSPRAPPVPAFPAQYLTATSPNPSNAESSGTTPGGGCLSPDPDTGFLKPQQGGVSKDMLATFYQVGTGSKQTKKGKPQRMYICSIPGCEKEFPRKSAVESHIQTHLEDKPFACPDDSCGASFVRSHDLTRHVRIHSGSKPFQCICGKGFARGDALTRHRQRGICEGSLVPRRW